MILKEKNNFFKTSDNVWIYFEDYGKDKKDTIIFLHGYLCSSKFFHKNIDELSKNHRVILVDWRGHGFSSKTLQNLTMARCAQDIYELIKYLKLEEVSLIGWSMGSSLVLEYYESYGKENLKKIGIIDSALYPFSSDEWNNHCLAGYNLDGMISTLEKALTDHDAYTRSFTRACFKNKLLPEDEEWISKEMKKIPVYIAFALYNDFLMSDYINTLKKISIPLLICCADSSVFPKGIEMGKYYRDLVNKNCYFYEFRNLGHAMLLEDPEQFNKVILDFVENYKE